VARVAATFGVLLAVALVMFRSTLEPWRAIAFEPESAAIGGVAVACAWGLSMALDLGRDRWWVGAAVGVGSTASLGVAGAVWIVPALLFAGGLFAASALTLARSNRAAWLAIAISDGALVAALAGYAMDAGAWELPAEMRGAVAVPLAISLLLRGGAIPRTGLAITAGTPAAAIAPLVIGSAFVILVRLVERPEPVAAAAGLLCACVVALLAVARRPLAPALVGAWPVLLGAGLVLASDRAAVLASVAAIVGVTTVLLWPDALERGRLSRGFVLSSIAPNVMFGAIATAAADAFVNATSAADPTDAAAWVMTSALLPVAVAAGVALGVVVARAEPRGGYHPEAVFMTWMLLAGSVAAGFVVGAGGVYESVGGMPAVVLFGGALVCGAIAARRVRERHLPPVEALAPAVLTAPRELGVWAAGAAFAGLIATAAAIGWLTIDGLRVGFL
jgi:hypothetical protein